MRGTTTKKIRWLVRQAIENEKARGATPPPGFGRRLERALRRGLQDVPRPARGPLVEGWVARVTARMPKAEEA